MSNLRNPNKVLLRDGRTLEEVLELHKKWILGEEGGKKACLKGENLSYTDLSGFILSYADLMSTDLSNSNLSHVNLNFSDLSNSNLSHVNLSYTNLIGADLSNTDLSYVDLRGSDLRYSDLSYSNLNGANLNDCKFCLTDLYKANGDFVGVDNIGSINDIAYYFYDIDRVICGCFDGTMEEFENEVKDTYEEDDKEYKQYMIAIDTLKKLAEIEK